MIIKMLNVKENVLEQLRKEFRCSEMEQGIGVKMKNRILSLSMVLVMFCCMFLYVPMYVNASEYEASGVCGDNLTWTLKNGVITISGKGEMYDYDRKYDEVSPWYIYKQEAIYNEELEMYQYVV